MFLNYPVILQLMRTLYQKDEVYLGGLDTAAFYKQVDHIISELKFQGEISTWSTAFRSNTHFV